MKNSPQPSEQNELRTQYAQIKSPVENKSEEQMLLDYLIDAGFMLDEALQLLDLREHLYSNTEMQQRIPYRILCNGVKRESVKASSDLAFRHFRYLALHKIRYGVES